jgi:hypothetical protein
MSHNACCSVPGTQSRAFAELGGYGFLGIGLNRSDRAPISGFGFGEALRADQKFKLVDARC